MKPLALLGISFLLSSNLALAAVPIIGSGRVVTEHRPIGFIDVLELSGTGSLMIERSDNEVGLWIEAEDNVMPHIMTEKEGDVLKISFEAEQELHPVYPIQYLLKVSDIQRIHLEGNASLEMVPSYHTDRIRIEIGDAAVAFIDVTADEVDWEVKGSGIVNVSGNVRKQKITVSDQATFNAAHLKSQQVQVAAHDKASVDVSADDELSIAAGGAAKVAYHGNPKLQKKLHGLATVTSS